MIRSVKNENQIYECFNDIGLDKDLKEKGSALIKINLARPPEIGHPRTDPMLLTKIIRYAIDNGCNCAIAESADGYLKENLKKIGLKWLLEEQKVEVIDLDFEDFDTVNIEDEEHYIPKCLKDYGVRIAIPVTSKRINMIFSNNIKLFVGAVPRKMYQIGEPVSWRPKIHLDLHKSVANIYKAIMKYAPFGFYVNGGNAFNEKVGEFKFEEILVDKNAMELDGYILNNIFKIEEPEYIKRLREGTNESG